MVAYNRINALSIQSLAPGTTYYYCVVSIEIINFDPYDLVYGEKIVSDIYSFTTPALDKNHVSLLIMNDIHDRPESIPHLMNLVIKKDIDYVFFNGDVFDHQEDEKQIIDHMLRPYAENVASEIPFYFVRGNHDTGGKFARNLHHYFFNPDNRQYYDFVCGSTHFTVIDSGEDKEDTNEVYGDIVEFDSYREEQLNWFKKVAETRAFKAAKFRVVLMHIPIYYSGDGHGITHLRKLFSSQFNEKEIDICISGHTHRYGIYKPEKEKHHYPIIMWGGPKEGNRTIISLRTTAQHLSVKMILDEGKLIGNYEITSRS